MILFGPEIWNHLGLGKPTTERPQSERPGIALNPPAAGLLRPVAESKLFLIYFSAWLEVLRHQPMLKSRSDIVFKSHSRSNSPGTKHFEETQFRRKRTWLLARKGKGLKAADWLEIAPVLQSRSAIGRITEVARHEPGELVVPHRLEEPGEHALLAERAVDERAVVRVAARGELVSRQRLRAALQGLIRAQPQG